jgi:hypothetical protein
VCVSFNSGTHHNHLNIFMPVCYLDDNPYDIILVETPMSNKWMDSFAGETLRLNTPYDRSTIDELYQLIITHKPLFAKLRLDFLTNITSKTELMHQQTLTDIHSSMVGLQKKHLRITDILVNNTKGGWENIHENIHRLEEQIRNTSMMFVRNSGLLHDNTDTAPGWKWDNIFTAQEWADSTDFSTSNLSIPTMELGRTPYEAFLFAPDNWRSEGSISGTLAPRAVLSTSRSQRRPDQGYEEWCETQGIPVIGDHLPLANFRDASYLDQIPTVNTIRIER